MQWLEFGLVGDTGLFPGCENIMLWRCYTTKFNLDWRTNNWVVGSGVRCCATEPQLGWRIEVPFTHLLKSGTQKGLRWWVAIVIVITFYSKFGFVRRQRRGLSSPAATCLRQPGKLWIPIFLIFGLTRPGIEPEFTVSVAEALSTRPYDWLDGRLYNSAGMKLSGVELRSRFSTNTKFSVTFKNYFHAFVWIATIEKIKLAAFGVWVRYLPAVPSPSLVSL